MAWHGMLQSWAVWTSLQGKAAQLRQELLSCSEVCAEQLL